ncbi:hypothetical protein A3I48_04275 [Candidatus Daviesbacteria bacterium RIFCSPLOWO2_02_FULL_36_7]|uniref:DUF5666 domain-containing protein n=1 Tax=Candidatus Daviesbacteria bacterium RIFCSPLOWO2_02_FULL_36_7 TaxID=1797792 RepID=A0A1F5MHW7_9BACT|nr:MAG: hypothetical protein A3I48_04275 [Candidatus Daviesbacteria bacterium RIFCSPLOWO2_02_FULL_36_7]
MRRVNSFQLTVFSVLIFFLLSAVNCTLYPAYAAESTPSADIKAKLEEFRKDIASKAAQLKQVINQKLRDKAYIGTVKSKSDNSLTLSAYSEPKVISINQDTIYESKIKSKKKFNSLQNISEEDYVAALGNIDETEVLTAKKIVLLSTASHKLKTYLWGQIISISDQLVTLKDKDFKNNAASLPDSSQVKLNDFVILTGTKDKNDIFDAGFVYVISQEGVIKPKKIATQSAAPKPTSR